MPATRAEMEAMLREATAALVRGRHGVAPDRVRYEVTRIHGPTEAGLDAVLVALLADDATAGKLVSRVDMTFDRQDGEPVVRLRIGPMAARREQRFWAGGEPLTPRGADDVGHPD